ncbi:hypothetical protein ACQCN2_08085 [Brevibacillus ginsengisoli]|uniref:hypothetical protein n=1 Tax=Brevibacillus ginsengisoli TaxID=363854 RepID=UPI003CED1A49
MKLEEQEVEEYSEKQIHQFDQIDDEKSEQVARKKYQKIFWAVIIASALAFVIFDTVLIVNIVMR